MNALTLNTRVIRLNECLLDLPILNQQRISLASLIAEDSYAIEREIESPGELARRVT
jgi:hypothetical protein